MEVQVLWDVTPLDCASVFGIEHYMPLKCQYLLLFNMT